MADSFLPYQNPTTTDAKLDSEQLVVGANTVERERVQIAGDSATDIVPVTAADGLLVNLGTNNDVTVTGTVTATGPLTDTELRATPVPVSGTVSVTEPVSIDDNGGSITVDGAVTVSATDLDIRNLVFATDKVDASGTTLGSNSGVDIGDVTINNAGGGAGVNIQDGGNSITVDNATLSVVGGGVEATALRVTLASDSTGVVSVDDNGGSLTVDGAVFAGKSATATLSNVSSSATNVTLLASNAARNGATIFNDSTKVLYVKYGATASATSFTVKMLAGAYHEVFGYYTGIIDGIWATANGSARITELTT